MSDSDYYVGFDLGGTKLQASALDASFKIIASERKKTKVFSGSEGVYERIQSCMSSLLESPDLKGRKLLGIGVGAPGILDPTSGTIVLAPNLHWENFPLAKRMQKDYGAPVAVDNDVNMGLYGEFKFGSGKGFNHLIGIFPGTGIGGGLILDGKLYRGAAGCAGELGHITIQEGGPAGAENMRGTLESLASRLVISKECAVAAARGQAPHLYKEAGTDVGRIRSGVIAKAIEQGDKAIENIVREAAGFLGVGMGSLVNIFNPEAFILGGGLVEKLESIYLEETAKAMRKNSFEFLSKNVAIKAASLGDDAAVMGAAVLISEHLESN